jgi:hypothetical protein
MPKTRRMRRTPGLRANCAAIAMCPLLTEAPLAAVVANRASPEKGYTPSMPSGTRACKGFATRKTRRGSDTGSPTSTYTSMCCKTFATHPRIKHSTRWQLFKRIFFMGWIRESHGHRYGVQIGKPRSAQARPRLRAYASERCLSPAGTSIEGTK